jgi:hypothetical protein
VDPLGVVAGEHQQLGGGVGTDAELLHQLGCVLGGQGLQQLVVDLDLLGQG